MGIISLTTTRETINMTTTTLIIKKVQSMIGKNIGQMIDEQNNEQLNAELRFSLQQRKGSLGVIVEQLVTGTRKNAEKYSTEWIFSATKAQL
jgi:hypothetical protein